MPSLLEFLENKIRIRQTQRLFFTQSTDRKNEKIYKQHVLPIAHKTPSNVLKEEPLEYLMR